MGQFRQIFKELSARDMPKFSFSDDNLSKHKWIFAKLGMCIDLIELSQSAYRIPGHSRIYHSSR